VRARTKIEAAFVRVQTDFVGDVVRDDLADHYLICMSHTEGADIRSALDQCDDSVLVR
jgi:hypothetical protein